MSNRFCIMRRALGAHSSPTFLSKTMYYNERQTNPNYVVWTYFKDDVMPLSFIEASLYIRDFRKNDHEPGIKYTMVPL